MYELIYFVQRGRSGWSERDCWGVDSHLSEIIPEMLRWLKVTKHGVPNEFVEMARKTREKSGIQVIDETDVDQGEKLFDAMLDEIIEGFEAHQNIDNHRDYNREEHQANEKIWRAKFLRGMELFIKYYDTLWD